MEDSQTSPSRDLDHAGNSTTTIPFIPLDLAFEIFSRLPGKSIIRFQSVSKLWFFIIHSKDFVDSFLTRSKTRPRLLLTLMRMGKRFIFSAPEHKNNDDDKSPIVIGRHDMSVDNHNHISRPVNGFVCFTGAVSSISVCNLTTRQIVKLPEVRPNGRKVYARLGYDPVEDQYKVLCVMMFIGYGDNDQQDIQQEHFVCTVRSSEKQEWRKIENTTGDSYRTVYEGICIDGAIYYGVGQSRIVRFHVRSEKMELIKAPKEANISTAYSSTLLDYNGKLGGVDYYDYKKEMRLWILEDAEKQEWSSMTFALPSEWEGLRGTYVVSKGVLHTGELMVFHPCLESSKPLCVSYYDFNKQSIRKVEFQRMKDGDFSCVLNPDGQMFGYRGHLENIRLL